ncbi:hypothetical protein ACQPYK_07470 [Streptosporangium sp. CA-135522]|uniref:hypothetical protein n=1 Tax=Streptosporangium sp. CA-135522 TaxID=3240072 RepID=UPI003D8EB003
MIVADTGAFLAALDSTAAEHSACVQVITQFKRPMLITHMAVAETGYLLTKRFGITAANRFLSDVARGAFTLLPADSKLP